ncbi:DUF308 domain-containing protein [Novosphingobium resinovorum]|jgi:uncharacterized membrane protein HdeD (DUF308 family)|uniref:Putative membrane protein n=1 Tax=Novosphingobium resinovorum TaxID=158500 RepID=A0A031K3N8_9SPHN|nr:MULTISPECIES: DUF308 domain-containing protein [Sphingomonadaceae]AOR76669.1 hypothetical protein BES08_07855 [Novosphingobium resinovorum]EJU11361.1 hypothetical protein LH128_19394 [Sphingomonas sp. LH128]EZP83825.1 putative membrane protein [Novosphingobium resinovorum]MBF7012012.1 DUF308 domain-containing protein [Novosphingobium sp. HR1a]WJM26763.1 DUF308 domain-containing protein [Novosphingobium resinovorum]
MQRTDVDPLLEPNVHRDPLVREMERAPGSTWGWVMAYGVLLILAALIVLLNPLVAGVATGLILGVILIVAGVAAVAAGWTSLSSRARWTEILLGVLALLAGIFAVADPVAGALSLVIAIGLWLVVSGVFQIAFALKARHDKGWRLLLGVLDVVLGMVLLFSSAATGLAFLAIIVAISLTVRAVFLIQLALLLKRS